MLMGKRPRPPVTRTTSLSIFSADDLDEPAPPPSNPDGDWLAGSHAAAMASARGGVQRRYSADFSVVKPANFLRACGLCKRRLAPGRDIFMYRGDIAFCSSECRQEQMSIDERQEKCYSTSVKSASNSSEESSGDGTAAAA